jgi:hypothetical protein
LLTGNQTNCSIDISFKYITLSKEIIAYFAKSSRYVYKVNLLINLPLKTSIEGTLEVKLDKLRKRDVKIAKQDAIV